MLMGGRPVPPTPSLGGPGGVFLGGFGHVFLGQHHQQHNWAFVSHFWPPQHIWGFGGVLKPHMCGVKREFGDPNRPHDAHGRLKCAINPNKKLKILTLSDHSSADHHVTVSHIEVDNTEYVWLKVKDRINCVACVFLFTTRCSPK